MRSVIVDFPGSACADDIETAILDVDLGPVERVWHDREGFATPPDLVILPGGASYGDYLRCGALAANSRIMKAVRAFAEFGGLVLGICNGFQILTEAKILPGVLLPNAGLRTVCSKCHIRVERNDTPFTKAFREKQIVQIPIAHYNGRYFLPDDELDELEREGRVVFRYADPDTGDAGESCSPNGSLRGIAGITNKEGNVLGLMPHPERATLKNIIRGTDGRAFWQSLCEHSDAPCPTVQDAAQLGAMEEKR